MNILLIVCLTAAISCQSTRQSIVTAFSYTGMDLTKKTLKSSEVFQYVVETRVKTSRDISSMQKGYYVYNMYPLGSNQILPGTNSYLGWIESYTDAEGKLSVIDYRSTTDPIKPVFRIEEDSKTGDIVQVTVLKDLKSDERNVVGVALDHFAPSVSQPSAYKLVRQADQLTLIDGTLTDNTVSQGGKIVHNIRLSPDNYVQQNIASYSFKMACVGDNINADVKLIMESKACDTWANLEATAETVLRSRMQPNLEIINLVKKTLDNQLALETSSRDIFDSKNQATIKAEYGAKATQTSVEVASSSIATTGKRLLAIVYPIFSTTKTLLSRTFLGKVFSIDVITSCSYIVNNITNLVSSSNQISCTGQVTLKYGSAVKNVPVFSFVKNITNWTQASTVSGGWGVSFSITLPPPVSFISVNLYVGYSYNFALSAYLLFISPNNVTAGCYANGTVSGYGSAGLRVLTLEGGVYISGSIAKILAEPTITGLVSMIPKKYQGTAMIKVTVYPITLTWGFYYRYKKVFGGWTGNIPISSWTIVQVYVPTIPVYSLAFTLYF